MTVLRSWYIKRSLSLFNGLISISALQVGTQYFLRAAQPLSKLIVRDVSGANIVDAWFVVFIDLPGIMGGSVTIAILERGTRIQHAVLLVFHLVCDIIPQRTHSRVLRLYAGLC